MRGDRLSVQPFLAWIEHGYAPIVVFLADHPQSNEFLNLGAPIPQADVSVSRKIASLYQAVAQRPVERLEVLGLVEASPATRSLSRGLFVVNGHWRRKFNMTGANLALNGRAAQRPSLLKPNLVLIPSRRGDLGNRLSKWERNLGSAYLQLRRAALLKGFVTFDQAMVNTPPFVGMNSGSFSPIPPVAVADCLGACSSTPWSCAYQAPANRRVDIRIAPAPIRMLICKEGSL